MNTTKTVHGTEEDSREAKAPVQRRRIQPMPVQKANRFVPGVVGRAQRTARTLLADPTPLADDLAVDDGGGGAAAAERKVGVADENVGNLPDGRPLVADGSGASAVQIVLHQINSRYSINAISETICQPGVRSRLLFGGETGEVREVAGKGAMRLLLHAPVAFQNLAPGGG